MNDRIHVGIDTVVRGEQPPLSDEEMQHLFVLDANILRNMDFARPPHQPHLKRSQRSVDITMQQRDGAEGSELNLSLIHI